MEKKIRYTLGKEERLKSRKVIEQLFKTGKSFSLFPFRVLYILKTDQPTLADNEVARPGSRLRAGFTVSTRHFKKAVDRNRVKRLMREAYRLQKNELRSLLELNKNTLALFFIYVGNELPGYEWVFEKMEIGLKRLIKLTSENR